jgi:hypothetical protein
MILILPGNGGGGLEMNGGKINSVYNAKLYMKNI